MIWSGVTKDERRERVRLSRGFLGKFGCEKSASKHCPSGLNCCFNRPTRCKQPTHDKANRGRKLPLVAWNAGAPEFHAVIKFRSDVIDNRP